LTDWLVGFLADRTLVMVKLLSWLLSVRLSVHPSRIGVAKRYKIGPRLLLITNRKFHVGFQITCKSLTLDDLEGHWQPVQ